MTKKEAIKYIEQIKSYYEKELCHSAIIGELQALDMASKALNQEPQTGRWIKNNPFIKPYCSECGASCHGLHGFDYTISPYCPNCGAKMESEVEE